MKTSKILSLSVWIIMIGVALCVIIGYKPSDSKHSECLVDTISTINHSYNNYKSSGTTDRSNDEEYWNSVARQKELEDRGMDRAAEMERKARLEYMQGGGYHSPDGTPQVHFQGSQEQAEQLRMMDEMGW